MQQLGSTQALLDQLNVVLVSYYDRETAIQWMQEVNTNFPMYLDSNRSVYNILGYSALARLNAKTVFRAIKLSVKSRTFVKLPTADTPKQMGGNVIITRDGKILYIHRCETPDDRPSADDLLKLLPTL